MGYNLAVTIHGHESLAGTDSNPLHMADHEIISRRHELARRYNGERHMSPAKVTLVQSLQSEIDALEASLPTSPDPRGVTGVTLTVHSTDARRVARIGPYVLSLRQLIRLRDYGLRRLRQL
jgi:hypothetical protein